MVADMGLYKEQRAVTAITGLLRVTTKRDCEVRITASENVLSPPGIICDCESERFAGWNELADPPVNELDGRPIRDSIDKFTTRDCS